MRVITVDTDRFSWYKQLGELWILLAVGVVRTIEERRVQ